MAARETPDDKLIVCWKTASTLEDAFRKALRDGLEENYAHLVQTLPPERREHYRAIWRQEMEKKKERGESKDGAIAHRVFGPSREPIHKMVASSEILNKWELACGLPHSPSLKARTLWNTVSCPECLEKKLEISTRFKRALGR